MITGDIIGGMIIESCFFYDYDVMTGFYMVRTNRKLYLLQIEIVPQSSESNVVFKLSLQNYQTIQTNLAPLPMYEFLEGETCAVCLANSSSYCCL